MNLDKRKDVSDQLIAGKSQREAAELLHVSTVNLTNSQLYHSLVLLFREKDLNP